MILHPWHSISIGNTAPEHVNSIIEIPKGSKAKYELDKETGLLRLDRILRTDLTYPVHYGLIPQTYCEDNDPLDILVLCSEPLIPLSIVEATVIGAMHMIDGGEQDDKIIAVARHDYAVNYISQLEQLPAQTLAGIKKFFEEYKLKEQKAVKIERFMNKHEAYEVIKKSALAYEARYRA